MKAFAQQAIDARFGGAKVTGIELEELLAVERNEDNGNTLWKVFNRVQEKIVGGSFTSTRSLCSSRTRFIAR